MAIVDRTTDISEAIADYYQQLIAQLPGIAIGISIIILGILIGSWVGSFTRTRLSANTDDPLMSQFLGKAVKYTIIAIAIMLGLRAADLGAIATGILTAAGASAVVFGFAFKEIGENFIAGIILAFNRPFDKS